MSLQLTVRREIRAPIERVFAAWTEPSLLKLWWGPSGVTCDEAEVDLRVGGAYRLANRLPDGSVLWIRGLFQQVEAPTLLVYTWHVGDGPKELVTVTFCASDDGTTVAVNHEHIFDEAAAIEHERGWLGCLDGLVELLDASAP